MRRFSLSQPIDTPLKNLAMVIQIMAPALIALALCDVRSFCHARLPVSCASFSTTPERWQMALESRANPLPSKHFFVLIHPSERTKACFNRKIKFFP